MCIFFLPQELDPHLTSETAEKTHPVAEHCVALDGEDWVNLSAQAEMHRLRCIEAQVEFRLV